jgi:hypothetical protein
MKSGCILKQKDSHACQAFTQTKSGCKRLSPEKDRSDFSSFSPTASQVTLRVILDLIAIVGFKSWCLDATCAFSSAPLPKGQKLFLKSIEDIPFQKARYSSC